MVEGIGEGEYLIKKIVNKGLMKEEDKGMLLVKVKMKKED